jgi:phage gpG-like protein
MASAQSSVTIDNLSRYFDAVGTPVDYKPCFKGIRLLLIAATKKNFDEERSPDGVAWAPLKHKRQRRRDRRRSRPPGSVDKILSDSGMLRSSNTAVNVEGNVNVETAMSLEWGSNLEYAAVHQFGHTFPPMKAKGKKSFSWIGDDGKRIFRKSIGKRVVPARPFIGINDELADDISDLVADFVVDELVKRLTA